jgi:hypothetical protein
VKSEAYRVAAICTIAGVEYSVVQFVCNYALNSVPTAYAALAVGANIRTGRLSEVHNGIEQTTEDGYMQPATIQMAVGDGSEAYVTVFEGYLTGLGYTKVSGQIMLVAHLTHWLIDLSFSTAITDSSHAINAAQLNTKSIYQTNGAGGLGASYFFSNRQYGLEFQKYKDDVAGGVIGFLSAVCDHDILTPGSALLCFGTGAGNTIAKRALVRFATNGFVGGLGAGGHAGGGGGLQPDFSGAVPGTLGGSIGGKVYDAMAQWMHSTTDASYFTTSLWDKLVSRIAPSFKLAVVPLVTKALLVPFTPCLRTVGGTVAREDVCSCDFQSYVPRPVRAVAVLGDIQNRTGAYGPAEALESENWGINGCFSRGEASGVVMFLDGPGWLQNIPALATDVADTSIGATGDGTRKPTPSATTLPADSAAVTESAIEATIHAQTLFTRLAESFYWQELLRGRTGTISTNFRWDIAPGSNIAVEMAGNRLFGKDNLEGRTMIGSVERLTMWADCEASRCGTSYQLAFCRSEKENDTMSVLAHPLYDNANTFTGASLVLR